MLIVLLIACLIAASVNASSPKLDKPDDASMVLSQKEKNLLRKEARDMFYHAYSSYMNHGFPADEVQPQSCRPREQASRGTIDDCLGDYALTLIDSLDTLIVFGDYMALEQAINKTVARVSFDKDVTVSVFETTIRILGGLISTHLLIRDRNISLPSYEGQLLMLAVDLADRLLPAFETPFGIPMTRVNLRRGRLPMLARERTTSVACAGSLLLEFGLLSRLTGNTVYETVASNAVRQLYQRRSPLGLLGNTIDVMTGSWVDTFSNVGAGADSFFEYLFKAYLLFDDVEYFHMFETCYSSIIQFLRTKEHWYGCSDMNSGSTVYGWTDSLAAFLPGLQVEFGDLENAINNHVQYYTVWRRYGAIPERFFVPGGQLFEGMKYYPLRPEFVESTYLLYRATRHPFYLHVGRHVLRSLQSFRTVCGYATVADVDTKRLDDRMESFFLSETCKYLYLLFDEANFVHSLDGRYLFNTEAHVFPIRSPLWILPRDMHDKSIVNRTCPNPNNILKKKHLDFDLSGRIIPTKEILSKVTKSKKPIKKQ